MKQLNVFSNPAVRWLMTLSWTTLIIIILLKPGSKVENYELSFNAFISSFFSFPLSDKWVAIEAIVHVFLFGILTYLWHWSLIMSYAKKNAVLLAISVAVLLGIGTEVGQYFVSRGSLLLDLLANILGVVIATIGIGYMTKFKIK